MRPRGPGLDQPVDEDVLRDVVLSLDAWPAAPRVGIVMGLYLLEYGAPLYARRWRRFSGLTPEVGQQHLAAWERLSGPRGIIFRALRRLVFLSFYEHPEILEALGVSREARAAALGQRRAELLRARSDEGRDDC